MNFDVLLLKPYEEALTMSTFVSLISARKYGGKYKGRNQQPNIIVMKNFVS